MSSAPTFADVPKVMDLTENEILLSVLTDEERKQLAERSKAFVAFLGKAMAEWLIAEWEAKGLLPENTPSDTLLSVLKSDMSHDPLPETIAPEFVTFRNWYAELYRTAIMRFRASHK